MRYDNPVVYLEDWFNWFKRFTFLGLEFRDEPHFIALKVPDRDKYLDIYQAVSDGYEPFTWAFPFNLVSIEDQLQAIIDRYNELPDTDGTREVSDTVYVPGDQQEVPDYVAGYPFLHICHRVRAVTIDCHEDKFDLTDDRIMTVSESLGRLFQFTPYISVLPQVVSRSSNPEFCWLFQVIKIDGKRTVKLSYVPISELENYKYITVFTTEKRIF